jgi:hypothetical protein
MKKMAFFWTLCILCFYSYLLEASLRATAESIVFEATYLYIRPISNYPYFAVQLDNVGRLTGKRFDNQFTFSSGYCLEASYTFCNDNYDTRARWTHLNSHAQKTLPSGLYVPAQVSYNNDTFVVGSTTPVSNRNIEYDALDILGGFTFFRPYSFVTIHAGVHWAKIDLNEDFIFFARPQDPFIDRARGEFTSNMHGIGPKLGVMGKWALPPFQKLPLFFNGKLEGAILFSHIKAGSDATILTNGVFINENIDNEGISSFTPHWTASFGISMEKLFWFRLAAEVGYTITGYCYALDILGYTDRGVFTNTLDLWDEIYFHGLYVTLGITY